MRVIHVFIAAVAAILAAAEDLQEPSTLNLVEGVIEKCLRKDELDVCLEEEAADAIGRALDADEIPLFGGLSLTKSPNAQDNAFDVDETGRSEPKTAYEKIWDNIERLISTRSLSLQLSDAGDERGHKKKRILHYAGVALATAAAILIPLKLKFIGLMAATALFIGKLALVLASLVGLKKLVSKPHEETTHLHYDGHRSDLNAHYLAYSGQQPNAVD